ncbi:cyanophycinase [Klenkia soli]|uniref:Cyanophycinase n=1 Tax=Klenkia soli TaxID=1052260 RepID=A0A1H0F423_9ACTN|nr:Type 1 glutamine amidotransferase-like domain-containing protein [Klenkia soli]SDN89303.1 cyanophycinase [Klenkia soli]
MTIHLVGGGPGTTDAALVAPFLAEVRGRGGRPRIGVVLAGTRVAERLARPGYARLLGGRSVDHVAVPLRPGRPVDPQLLAALDGLVVGGGRTPRYLAGLAGAADAVGAAVRSGLPYLGFSAGAMVAPDLALAGGWRSQGRPVAPRAWSEGLDELTSRPGLGLVRFAVDVHTAQAGTLGRTTALVAAGRPVAVGVDEGTCLALEPGAADPDDGTVRGAGAVWTVRRSPDGVPLVTRRPAR